jgi:PAS domain S-box-containing protein
VLYLLSAIVGFLSGALARARRATLPREASVPDATSAQLQSALADAERARDAEHAALRQLTATLDSLSDIVIGCSSDWRIRSANSAARERMRVIGVDMERAIGQILWDVIPVVRGTRIEEAAQRAMRDRTLVEMEIPSSVSARTYHLRIFPTDDGGITYYARDITARKVAERARLQSEERYRALVEASSDMVWSTDGSGMVEDMPDWRALTGQTVEEVRGQGWLDAVHPDDRARSAEIWWAAYAGGRRYENEYRIRTRDGSYRWVRARGVPIADDRGRIVEWVGTVDDIHDAHAATARKDFLQRASDALGATLDIDATLRTLTHLCVPTLADYASVDLLTEQGEIRRVETAHVDPAKELIVRELWSRFPYHATDEVGVPEVIRSGRAAFVPEFPESQVAAFVTSPEQLAMIHALGPRSYICVPLVARGKAFGTLSLVYSDSGRRYGSLELELAEEIARRAATAIEHARLFHEAEAANRAKTEFLATMSHELRTPLNAIAGYAELLALGIHGPVTAEQHEAIRRVQRSQRHLLSLVNDVLNFARIDSGNVQYHMERVALDETLQAVEPLIAPQLAGKGLAYEYCAPDGGIAVQADREKLQQIILNLLSNAVKFTESNGRISVTCEARDAEIIVRVTDTGRGIPQDKLEAIFEPFVQIDRGLTRTTEGIGLGLAISRELARGMGGELSATSTPGAGSTFALVLRRADAGVAAPPAATIGDRTDRVGAD